MLRRSSIAILLFTIVAGIPALAEEIWVPPTHLVPAGLNLFPWPTSGSGYASFGFAVPDDFAALSKVTVAVAPRSSYTGTFDVYGSVKQDGALVNQGYFQLLGNPVTLSGGRMEEVEITALLGSRLGAPSAGRDYVAVFFYFPSSPALEYGTILGMRFVYDSVGIATSDLENGAVTNVKIADNSVGTDKVINGSLGTDDIQNGSLTGADIANSSLGSIDVDSSEVQVRVAGSCALGNSIRSIQADGDVVCEPDDEGVTAVIATLEYTSCGGTTACIRTVECDENRRVTGGGMRLDEEFTYARYDDVDLVESYPNGNYAWTVALVNNNPLAVNMYIYAACAHEDASAASAREPAPRKRHEDRPLVRE